MPFLRSKDAMSYLWLPPRLIDLCTQSVPDRCVERIVLSILMWCQDVLECAYVFTCSAEKEPETKRTSHFEWTLRRHWVTRDQRKEHLHEYTYHRKSHGWGQ